MSVQLGTNNKKIINDAYEVEYVDEQRKIYRAFDKLVNNNVIAIQNDPPLNPANGDSFLSDSAPMGAWTVPFAFYTWREGVTSGITNAPVDPFWEMDNPAGLVLFVDASGNWFVKSQIGYIPFLQNANFNTVTINIFANICSAVQITNTGLIVQGPAAYQKLSDDTFQYEPNEIGGADAIFEQLNQAKTINPSATIDLVVLKKTKFATIGIKQYNDEDGFESALFHVTRDLSGNAVLITVFNYFIEKINFTVSTVGEKVHFIGENLDSVNLANITLIIDCY